MKSLILLDPSTNQPVPNGVSTVMNDQSIKPQERKRITPKRRSEEEEDYYYDSIYRKKGAKL
jgi:hypothetical protein